jgi:hypothetical protein
MFWQAVFHDVKYLGLMWIFFLRDGHAVDDDRPENDPHQKQDEHKYIK